MGSYKKGVFVIACYRLDGTLIKTYTSARIASRSINVFKRTIDKAIREKQIIHNKQWRRFPTGEVPEQIDAIKIEAFDIATRPISLIDENNKVIKTYRSVRSAAINNNIDPHTIRDMLRGKTKTAKGLRFRYSNSKEIDESGFEVKVPIKVRQYSLDGKLIKIHRSIYSAAKSINVHRRSIELCLKNEGKTVGGFYWIKDDENAEERLKVLMNRKRFFYTTIIQFDKKGKEIARYKSAKEVEKTTGINSRTITQAIRSKGTAKGYYWKGEKS